MSQQINLYNPALRKPRELVTAVNLALAVGVALLFVVMVGGATRYALHNASAEAASAAESLKSAQDQLVTVNAQFAAHQPDSALQHEVDAAQSLLKSRDEVLTALNSVSIEPGKGFADYLRGLARQSVLGMWLTAVSVGPGNELSIRGRTINQSLVADYVKRLTGEPVFAGHRFAQMTMNQVATNDVTTSAGAAAAAAGASPDRPIEFYLLTSPASSVAPTGSPTLSAVAANPSPLNIASLAGGQP